MKRIAPFVLVLATACGGGGGDTPTAPVAVASVSLSASVTTLNVGETATLTASPKDASGNVLTGRLATWISSTFASTASACSPLIVCFFASTCAAGVIPRFARNPCVLAQVIQPFR